MSGSTYTFTQKVEQVEPGQEDNFGGVVVDGNHNSMGSVGAGFQTTDISASAIVSPATVTTGGTTITVPLNAISISIFATANPLLISETSAYTNTFLLPVSTLIKIDCARMANIYLKGSGGSSTVQFYFNVV